MDFKKTFKLFLLIAITSVLAYTLTFRSISKKYEAQVASLKSEVQLKDQMIVDLQNKLNPPKAVSIRSVIQTVGVSPSDLQQALKKNGLYAGSVDGRLTQRVVEAVREFQRRNNIQVDGVVGKRTWKLLRDSSK